MYFLHKLTASAWRRRSSKYATENFLQRAYKTRDVFLLVNTICLTACVCVCVHHSRMLASHSLDFAKVSFPATKCKFAQAKIYLPID